MIFPTENKCVTEFKPLGLATIVTFTRKRKFPEEEIVDCSVNAVFCTLIPQHFISECCITIIILSFFTQCFIIQILCPYFLIAFLAEYAIFIDYFLFHWIFLLCCVSLLFIYASFREILLHHQLFPLVNNVFSLPRKAINWFYFSLYWILYLGNEISWIDLQPQRRKEYTCCCTST